MCYHWIITSRSLVWFLLSLIMSMLIACSIVLPSWLEGNAIIVRVDNFTLSRRPSVGINTRCLVTDSRYDCGSFDLDGLATDSSIYPVPFKATMLFLSTALFCSSISIFLTLISCCRQSVFGKSIHAVTGSGQGFVGILVLIAVFLHPLGWGSPRVQRLCGPDASFFQSGECRIGLAMILGIVVVPLSFCCAFLSLKAESSNLRSKVRRRIEHHGEKLICIC